MSKTAMIRARMEPDLKTEAEHVLAQVGLTPTEAIRLFYRQVSLQGGLPFEVRVPNAKTKAAIIEARSGKKLKTYKSAVALMRTAGA